METIPMPSRHNTTLRVASSMLALGLLAACAPSETQDEKQARLVSICDIENAHAAPSVANAPTLKDDRTGDILACQYLMDVRIPYNKPVSLFSMTSETYDSQEFTKHGDLGGWMFIGIGGMSGSSTESGETVRKRVNMIRIVDIDGNLQTLTLDAEKVKIRPCPDDCEPTVEIKIINEALWEKEEDDNSSIWYSNYDDGYDEDRQNVVRAIGLYLGDKDNLPPDEDPIYGSPRKPGEVVSMIASEIIVSLPEKDIQ